MKSFFFATRVYITHANIMIWIVSHKLYRYEFSKTPELVPHNKGFQSGDTKIIQIIIAMLKQDESNGTFMFKTGILLTLVSQFNNHSIFILN